MYHKKIIIFTISLISIFTNAQKSFTIDQAVEYALENNTQILKAKIDRQIADQKVKETTGIGLPQLNAQGQYNYFLNIPVQLLPAEIVGGPKGEFVPVRFGQKQSMSGGLTLSQLLFNGSYLVGLQSSKAYKETMQLAEEKTKVSIKEAILLAYTAAIITDENLKTIEENRKTIEKSLNETKETYKIGLIELQNVEQLEYSYKNLVANLQNLLRTKEKAIGALKYLMGYPLEEEIALQSNLQEIISKIEILSTVSDLDFENHIDHRLKKNVLRLNELKLKLNKSKALPTLAAALSTSYNGFGQEFNFLKSSQQWFNTSVIALQLDIPIFSGMQRHWQTQQAKLDVEKAQLDIQESRRNLSNQAKSAYLDYQNAYNSYKNAEELIALSNSIFKKQQIKFKEGMGTSFELSQAESQLYNAQTQYYQAALDLIQAKVKLDEAQGKL